MHKLFLILPLIFIFNSAFSADTTLDVYGVEDSIAKQIVHCCDKTIRQHVEMESQMGSMAPHQLEKSLAKHLQLRNSILQEINKLGDFYLVDISTVYYPNLNKRYTTIDVVPASQKNVRVPKHPPRTIEAERTLKPQTQAIFNLWNEYNDHNIRLLNKEQFNHKEKTCPVTHCLWGFDEQERVTYLPKLHEFANAHPAELMDIIRLSPNEEQRGNAIFILAHADDYQATATFLLDYMDDESDLVRNNSMRVIGAIVSAHKIENLPLEKTLTALNYPFVTDRNKAAYILLGLIKTDPASHAQVINQAGDTLLALLKLKQPNNHDYAYQILKELSKEDYNEHDHTSWAQWLHKQQRITEA